MHKAGFVRRITVTKRETPAFEGTSFGSVGAYELVYGRAFCELDPSHRLNSCIVNVARAPRNAAGLVQYDFDYCVLKPVDLERGNGWLFYELPNRGNKLAIGRIHGVLPNNDLSDKAVVGNGFLMRRGFTIVWSAWQGDAPRGNQRLQASLPIARLIDGPLTGRSRDEFILEPSPTNDVITKLSDDRFTARLSYPAQSLAENATLSVRQREGDERISLPRDTWRYRDDDHIEVSRPDGYDLGAIYEFIYTARDPIVMGIGLAGIRDFVSFLRREDTDKEGNDNPLRKARQLLKHTLAFGASQSGRVLRDFLYEGFNENDEGQPVFDAVLPVVTGSRRSFVNAAFAQPGRFSRQHEDHLYAGDQFPFSYTTFYDPLSGRTDGILARAEQAVVCPKILHLETESELWAGRSSLLVTDTNGRDLELPGNVRVYMASGIPHDTKPPPKGIVAHAHNPVLYARPVRAVLAALVDWVTDGKPPPPSTFPSRSQGTLVDLESAASQFPRIPNVTYPTVFNRLHVKDHSVEPPIEGQPYPVYLAATDADGNAIGGIRDPLLAAPVGTLTGWMARAQGYAEGELYSISGAFFPFPDTTKRQMESGDPRRSLEERYGTVEKWLNILKSAAADLVRQRLLLPEDADTLIDAARRGWEITHLK